MIIKYRSLNHSVSDWQGHLLSCPGQLKKVMETTQILTYLGSWGHFFCRWLGWLVRPFATTAKTMRTTFLWKTMLKWLFTPFHINCQYNTNVLRIVEDEDNIVCEWLKLTVPHCPGPKLTTPARLCLPLLSTSTVSGPPLSPCSCKHQISHFLLTFYDCKI